MPRDPFLLRVLFKAIQPSTSQANLYRWIALVSVPVYGYAYFGAPYLTDWHVFAGATLLLYMLAVVCLAPLNYFTVRTMRRYPEPNQASERFVTHALALGLTTGGGTFFTIWLFDATHLFGYRYSPTMTVWLVVSVMVFNVLIAGLFEVALAFSQWQTNQLGVERLEHQQLRGQLDEVKQQISPHFLFNSLNSLSVLIGEDAPQAERFVDDMAKVYRYLLQAHRPSQLPGQPGLTTLEAELRYMQSYAHLLRTRYGPALDLDVASASSEGCATSGLLPLTLQTLVDNAIRHNVVSATRPLRITIGTTPAGEVRVQNTRQKRSVRVPVQQESLTTLQARYQQLGGPSAIAVEADDAQFTVAIKLRPC